MQIKLAEIGKKFNREWIFRDLNFKFISGSTYAIHGPNGSGKSTLLKIISSAELPSKGTINYNLPKEGDLEASEMYKHISYVGPYMDLPELLTIQEIYEFNSKFKEIKLDFSSFIEKVYLKNDLKKPIKNYSSGMKQRLKLGLSILSNSSLLILDEPCSNLDKMGVELYQSLLKENSNNRTILIGSNEDKNETFMAEQAINIMNYK